MPLCRLGCLDSDVYDSGARTSNAEVVLDLDNRLDDLKSWIVDPSTMTGSDMIVSCRHMTQEPAYQRGSRLCKEEKSDAGYSGVMRVIIRSAI